jgi:thiol-disulfide isomerase/thioredoxin
VSIDFSRTRRHCLAAAAAFAWARPAPATEGQRSAWPRQRPTPAIELPALDGGAWQLAAARGRPVLLNFWATWCEPCRTEMPALQQLATDYQAQGLQLMAVNYREAEAKVRRFIETTALGLSVLFDRDGTAAKAFGVRIFPSTVAIDRRGQARFIVTGEFDWASPLARRWVVELL